MSFINLFHLNLDTEAAIAMWKYFVFAIFIVSLRLLWHSYLQSISARFLTQPILRFFLRFTRLCFSFMILFMSDDCMTITIWIALSKYASELFRKWRTKKQILFRMLDFFWLCILLNALYHFGWSNIQDIQVEGELPPILQSIPSSFSPLIQFFTPNALSFKTSTTSINAMNPMNSNTLNTMNSNTLNNNLGEVGSLAGDNLKCAWMTALASHIKLYEIIIFSRGLYRIAFSWPVLIGELVDPVINVDWCMCLLSAMRAAVSIYIAYLWFILPTQNVLFTTCFSGIALCCLIAFVMDVQYLMKTSEKKKQVKRELLRRSYSMEI